MEVVDNLQLLESMFLYKFLINVTKLTLIFQQSATKMMIQKGKWLKEMMQRSLQSKWEFKYLKQVQKTIKM